MRHGPDDGLQRDDTRRAAWAKAAQENLNARIRVDSAPMRSVPCFPEYESVAIQNPRRDGEGSEHYVRRIANLVAGRPEDWRLPEERPRGERLPFMERLAQIWTDRREDYF